MKFSDRLGFTQPRDIVQKNTMDEPLRNGLWNVICLGCFHNLKIGDYGEPDGIRHLFAVRLWRHYFHKRIDKIPSKWYEIKGEIESYFFGCEWFDVYNLIEFIGSEFEFKSVGISNRDFYDANNRELKRHMSGWRFVEGKLAPIVEDAEIKAIEDAIENASTPVRTHLDRSLERLSDRNNPDYRNAIKEAISAVEAQVKISVNSDKGTLGDLLKKMDDELGLHPALREAFSKLYGYTSDKNGIRHALMEKDDLDQQDALFMLVTCSAFVNLVQAKTNA